MTQVVSPEVIYPDCDGQPMADNTVQFRWIQTIEGELEGLFEQDPDVFVAGDLLWYPVEFQPEVRVAPDVLIAFGRPKGDRGSYRQWDEGGIAPQVVFEILSPGNRRAAMEEKRDFYEKYGVEEYYIYDPDRGRLTGYLRSDDAFVKIAAMKGWTSPRLKIRFEMVDGELSLYHPDGRRFASHREVTLRWANAEAKLKLSDAKAKQAEAEKKIAREAEAKAEEMAAKAEAEKKELEAEKRRADAVSENLRARLRALGYTNF